jgi:hypothetical protein
MWPWPTRQYRPLSGLGVLSLCITLLYMVYATHGHTQPQPTDPLAVSSAVESQLSGAQTVAYAPAGKATGIVQQAICQAGQAVTTELTCTILFNDQTGAYTISVITDTQGDWHQLCEPGDQQAGQLCRETATP